MISAPKHLREFRPKHLLTPVLAALRRHNFQMTAERIVFFQGSRVQFLNDAGAAHGNVTGINYALR